MIGKAPFSQVGDVQTMCIAYMFELPHGVYARRIEKPDWRVGVRRIAKRFSSHRFRPQNCWETLGAEKYRRAGIRVLLHNEASGADSILDDLCVYIK